MKLRSSKAACYVGAAIVLFMTPVLPAVATTYEKTQNTDTGIKVASYSANTEEVLVTGYEETGTYKNKAVAITDPYLDVYDTSDEETAQVVGRLYTNTLVDVDMVGKEWTKVSSGNCEGYVQTQCLCFGEEAEAIAEQIGTDNLLAGYTIAEIEAIEAEEEAERLDDEEKQKNKELKKAAAIEKKEKKKQAAEQKKAAKTKKEKQPKPKKEKKTKEPPKPGDILKIKPVSLIMLVFFVAGVVVLVCMLNSALYYNTNSSQAKTYYNNGEYAKAYSKLNGMKLNSNDKTLYEQASTIMYVRRQYDSYNNYMSLNMKTEALNALIKGIDRYNIYRSSAQELGIDDKFKAEYQNVIDALQNTFKISEAQGISLADMSNSDFTNYYLKIKEYGKAVQ